MKPNTTLAAAALIVLVVGGWWLFSRVAGGEPIDLISTDRFATVKKQPVPDIFSLIEATLNGDARRAIAVQPAPGSRLTWKIRVPDDAWLDLAVGLQPEAWTQEGNGVLFRAGVSDGRTYEELFTLHLNPFANAGERRWVPVMVDLSAYGGEEVDVIINTNASPPTQAEDHRNDFALWATPRVITR